MSNRLCVSVSLWLVSSVLGAAMLSAAQRAPTPDPINLPPEVLSLACAPTLTFEEPATPVRVTGSQNSSIHKNFAPGDLITINAGTDNGIEVGQLYYTRRLVPRERQRSIGRDNPATIQTTGWLRIYAVDNTMSLATISIRATRSTCTTISSRSCCRRCRPCLPTGCPRSAATTDA